MPTEPNRDDNIGFKTLYELKHMLSNGIMPRAEHLVQAFNCECQATLSPRYILPTPFERDLYDQDPGHRKPDLGEMVVIAALIRDERKFRVLFIYLLNMAEDWRFLKEQTVRKSKPTYSAYGNSNDAMLKTLCDGGRRYIERIQLYRDASEQARMRKPKDPETLKKGQFLLNAADQIWMFEKRFRCGDDGSFKQGYEAWLRRKAIREKENPWAGATRRPQKEKCLEMFGLPEISDETWVLYLKSLLSEPRASIEKAEDDLWGRRLVKCKEPPNPEMLEMEVMAVIMYLMRKKEFFVAPRIYRKWKKILERRQLYGDPFFELIIHERSQSEIENIIAERDARRAERMKEIKNSRNG